jgi:formate/nitrite transporter FocA (FNT family)
MNRFVRVFLAYNVGSYVYAFWLGGTVGNFVHGVVVSGIVLTLAYLHPDRSEQ